MGRIRIVDRAGSTNAVLLGDRGAIEGDWLVALAQDEGRGRQGRAWSSLEGNFAGSTIIQIRHDDPPAPGLSLACGLALIEAVDAVAPGAATLLKWPNDLLLGQAKLAGILLERSGNRIVAGFGINLAEAPAIEGRATASLDRVITPQALVPILAASMARLIGLWRASDPASFGRAWLARAHPVGTALSVHDGSGKRLVGNFEGLDPDGSLRLRLDGGAIEIVRAGDVTLD
jgi:BirA family biotin operon repressor/biotin-[acetyl-CoA-carboxylase] ligase